MRNIRSFILELSGRRKRQVVGGAVIGGTTVFALLLVVTSSGSVDEDTVIRTPACDQGEVVRNIITTQRPKMGGLEVEFLASMSETFAKDEGISPALVVAMWAQESQYRHHLVSNKGARGLSQIMPAWLKEHPEYCKGIDLMESESNAKCGVKILADYIKGEGPGNAPCKGVFNGLRCYNGGPRSLRNPETEKYAKEVLNRVAMSSIKVCKTLPGIAD